MFGLNNRSPARREDVPDPAHNNIKRVGIPCRRDQLITL